MKRKNKLFVVMLSMALMFTGCASGATDSNVEVSKETEKTLVVYSPQADADRGEWLTRRAKSDLGIDVQFLTAGGGDLADRLVAEKANPQADVVTGLVQTSMYQLKDQDIITPYSPKWAYGLPEVYKDKDSYFHSFWQTPIVVAYNTDYIKQEDAPKTWEDLAESKYKEKYAIGDITSQTVRTYITGILWDYVDTTTGEVSEAGWSKLSQIYENSRILPTDTDGWGEMASGETPIILSWLGGIINNAEKNNIPVEYVIPEKGTPVVAEAIALVKGSRNEDLAKEFIDWFGSPEVMADYANTFSQAPAHPEAIELCNDEIKNIATMFKAQEIDWEIVSKGLNGWLEKIELEIIK